MKLINSVLTFAALFTWLADAESVDRDLQTKSAPVKAPVPVPAPVKAPVPVASPGGGTTSTKKALGEICQVTYNAGAEKYMDVKNMGCAAGLVCSELNDNGIDGAVFTGKCNRESCDGTADPSADQQTSSRRVTICHRTCSETNPWVRITIDDDAWGGRDASGCGHRQHNVTQECNKADYSAWGPNRVDYLIKDHGTRSDVRAANPTWTTADEKAYWFLWERACPYVRAKKLSGKPCCDWAKGECCGPHPDDKCPMDPNKTVPGQCGCGRADTDTDKDGIADCVDKCPGFNDMLDTDKDGVPDGCDKCALGNDKIDTNKDGIPDACDICPNNMFVSAQSGLKGCTCSATQAQLLAGCAPPAAPAAAPTPKVEVVQCPLCGCGKVDVDTDGDKVLDCFDLCPNDPKKSTSTGVCGCGKPETDSDGDGSPDCVDVCPNDSKKIKSAGLCGCGVTELDTDKDGTPDCKDACPSDPKKIFEGKCGCGVTDVDSDTDQTPDCMDKCPTDNMKIDPGLCGCGVSDCDSDLDGAPNCKDECPRDASKIKMGVCGCGVSDIDSDNDGTPDCKDACQYDPLKIEPGLCGCSKVDSDNDGTCDEKDQCPTDPDKNVKGQCGCDVGETDSDFDRVADCVDGCTLDGTKTSPGVCGCGTPDTDSDKDGKPDCVDGCANDADKVAPGVCGCGVSDI